MAEKSDLLRKIRGLMDKAASTSFEAERDAFLLKADELMTTYTIESWELEFARPAAERERPIMQEYEYGSTGDEDSDDKLSQLFYALSRYTRVKVGMYGWRRSKIVGYKADLEYLDLLFTTLRLHLSKNMVPHPSTELQYLENLALLKEAGFKWQRIYEELVPFYPDQFPLGEVPREEAQERASRQFLEVPDAHTPGGVRYFRLTMPRPIGVRFTGEYTKFCKTQGRERIYSSPASYRKWFMIGYVDRIDSRLHKMRMARGDQEQGHAVELAGREEDLLKKLYEEFPSLAPHPENCECDACHVGKCTDPKCMRPLCVQRRKPVKYTRPRTARDDRVDHAARSRGQAAANEADLLGSRHNLAPKQGLGGGDS